MNKQKSHAFGNDTYLLGRDNHGDYLWLEVESWSCGWYWSAGHVETYTNPLDPAKARDIKSHTHYNDLVGHQTQGGYVRHLNQILEESTLTDSESWQLADLMQSVYTLKSAAEVLGRGGSHLASTTLPAIKQPAMVKTINDIFLPALFNEIHALLEPNS